MRHLKIWLGQYARHELERTELLKITHQGISWRYTEYKYKKRLLLRCIHHFKSDLINNMDHMRISGTEPSSVILSQTK